MSRSEGPGGRIGIKESSWLRTICGGGSAVTLIGKPAGPSGPIVEMAQNFRTECRLALATGLNPSAETNRGEHTRRPIIFSFLKFFHTVESLRLAKRSRALVETNPARNSQLETHQDDDPGSRLRAASFSLIHRIERSPHALKNSRPQVRLMLRVSSFARTALGSDSPMRNGVVCHCSRPR